MFLKQTIERNPQLIEESFALHQNGMILPDSYVIDVDTFLDNASMLLEKAKERGIKLYFMLKQLGRNPYLAAELVKLGYCGAVVVDYKEAQVMMKHNIPIGNIGHLVQIPSALIPEVVAYKPEVITVYSLEKIRQIHDAAKGLDLVQPILLRVSAEGDMIYSGQTAGFHLDEIKEIAENIRKNYAHVSIAGITSFPCFLYDEAGTEIKKTHNLDTVMEAKKILEQAGVISNIINTPSATCMATLPLIKQEGGNCGEPGHGLTGTTPFHGVKELEERPCVVYVSEISHNFSNQGYCFGGGHYRRSHIEQALIGTSLSSSKVHKVIPPADDSIDYHFGLEGEQKIGDTVIMAFRFQIFVTRSNVVLISGFKNQQPKMIGIYDSQGREL